MYIVYTALFIQGLLCYAMFRGGIIYIFSRVNATLEVGKSVDRSVGGSVGLLVSWLVGQ